MAIFHPAKPELVCAGRVCVKGALPQSGGIVAGAKSRLPLGMALGCAIGFFEYLRNKEKGFSDGLFRKGHNFGSGNAWHC